ncbi:MAG: hypothetical protein ACOCUD_00720 [Bacillota bacterium]
MKKIFLFFSSLVLILAMMGCPTKVNRPPKIMQLEDGELVEVEDEDGNSRIVYYHDQGTDFHPELMVDDLIENQNLIAIDYKQDELIIGRKRNYVDISDRIEVTSFYAVWPDGSDADQDGDIDEDDEELWGEFKTDEDGNKIYDEGKIRLVEILPVGDEIGFTLVVEDDNGAKAELEGVIIIE